MTGSLAEHLWTTFTRAAIVVVASALLPACGGGGGDGDSQSPPRISNFTFIPTVLYVGSIQPFSGSFDFTDPDGDLASATLEILDSSGKLLQSQSIPIEGVSGLRSGSIEGLVEGDTSTAGTFTVRVHVTDRAGLASNTLTASLRISEFPWVARSPMPLPRRDFATATIDGKIYVLGGGDTTVPVTPSPPTATVQVYDPATNSWTAATPMLLALTNHAAAVVAGKIHVAGGRAEFSPGVKTLQVYDPATGLWTLKADLPAERVDSAATGAGGIFLLFGGRDPGTATSTVFAYDPALDQWSTRAPMPDARYDLSAIAVNGKSYILGGYGSLSGPDGGYYRTMYEYDPGTNAWTQRTDMLSPRMNFAVALLGGKIYTAGGSNWDPALEDVAVYDPATSLWAAKTALPQPLSWPRGEAVNGKMYVFDGSFTLEYTPANDIL
jgi:hypothetical protein